MTNSFSYESLLVGRSEKTTDIFALSHIHSPFIPLLDKIINLSVINASHSPCTLAQFFLFTSDLRDQK